MKQLQEFYDALEGKTRDNGDEFVCFRDGSPAWMTAIVRDIHQDMLPDDTKYGMIAECACALLDHGKLDDDIVFEIADGLVDIYNGERVKWLDSHLNRAYYVDEARDEGLLTDNSGIFEQLGVGQSMEYQEILYALVHAFRDCTFDSEHTAAASGL